MNYRVLSLSVIVCCSLIKVFGIYWMFVALSCVIVFVLGVLSVVFSDSTSQSVNAILRNPLEQQIRIKLKLESELN